ncbi:hypothetical protein [Moraxella lacunata]
MSIQSNNSSCFKSLCLTFKAGLVFDKKQVILKLHFKTGKVTATWCNVTG